MNNYFAVPVAHHVRGKIFTRTRSPQRAASPEPSPRRTWLCGGKRDGSSDESSKDVVRKYECRQIGPRPPARLGNLTASPMAPPSICFARPIPSFAPSVQRQHFKDPRPPPKPESRPQVQFQYQAPRQPHVQQRETQTPSDDSQVCRTAIHAAAVSHPQTVYSTIIREPSMNIPESPRDISEPPRNKPVHPTPEIRRTEPLYMTNPSNGVPCPTSLPSYPPPRSVPSSRLSVAQSCRMAFLPGGIRDSTERRFELTVYDNIDMYETEEHPTSSIGKAIIHGQQVIVKMPKYSTTWSLLKEAHILSRLCHPNVVKIAGVTKGDTPPCDAWVVMHSVGHFDHWDALNHEGRLRLPDDKLIKLCLRLAETVAYLHRATDDRGVIVHRGIQPENIRLSHYFDDLWLGGFGKAVETIDGTFALQDESLPVAMWFAPPEVLQYGVDLNRARPEENFSTAWDVWSMGLVMASFMGAKHDYVDSYEDSRITEVMCEHAKAGKLTISVPKNRPLSKIVKKCLAIDPAYRPTAEAVFQEISNVNNF